MQASPGSRYYYPDVVVSCNDPRDEPDEYTKTHPVLIVEVLSPSTAATDRREKRIVYLAMDSLIDYVLVDPETGTVECLARDGEGWSHVVFGVGESADASIEFALRVDDVFAGVDES